MKGARVGANAVVTKSIKRIYDGVPARGLEIKISRIHCLWHANRFGNQT